MQRMKFVLFSMLVSSSIFAAYSVSGFYFTVAYATATLFRPINLFSPFMAQTYEMSHPDDLQRLVEAIYLARFEEDLCKEEEGYYMLVEIMRAPELAKALTGSSMKGDAHPATDTLPPNMRKKLAHLEELERKGYEVEDLKKKVMEKAESNKWE
jgi:hypothetical protein